MSAVLAPEPRVIDPADHVRWARSIARGVRRDYRFWRGSQEEKELEGAAYLVLVAYANRFDPTIAYRRGAERAMRRAAHAYRIGQPPPAGGALYGSRVAVCGLVQTTWVERKARRLVKDRCNQAAKAYAREFAYRAALEYAARFDAGGAFRGYAAHQIRAWCQQESVRLRNGGTFFRASSALSKDVLLVSLPEGPDGEDALECRRPELTDDDDEWSPYVTSLED